MALRVIPASFQQVRAKPSTTGPKQFFAMQSTEAGYAAALAALPNATVLGDAVHDSDLKIVEAFVTEEHIDQTAALENARKANYPTALFRHRWTSEENFNALGGQHMLGFSEVSYERDRSGNVMFGRPGMIFIRPQQTFDPVDFNFGNGDGTTHYDAANGSQDPAIDKGLLGTAIWNKGYSFVYCDGSHHRWGDHSNGGNPDQFNGVAAQGLYEVEDATAADADKIYVYHDWDMMPAMMTGGYQSWKQGTSLTPELYDAANNIWVIGNFNQGSNVTGLSQTDLALDLDVGDITMSMKLMQERLILQGKVSLSDLNGPTGRGRFHVQDNTDGSDQDWDGVHVWNTSTFSDITTAANDSTIDDHELLAVSAPNDSYVAWVDSVPFSVLRLNLSQNQIGGTGVWEYSTGSGTWATLTGIVDPTSGFTTLTNTQTIEFNPKLDWATDTVNGTTGYAIRWRKTGGTVTTAARGDQSRRRSSALFIHRWDDSAPVDGLSHWGFNSNGQGHIGGYCWELDGKGNVEFVRVRHFGRAAIGNLNGADHIVFTGCQWGLCGNFTTNSVGTVRHTFQAASYGRRNWAISDHFRQNKNHPGIQRILASMQWAVDNGVTTTPDGNPIDFTAFDDMPDWNDFFGMDSGIYGSGGTTWFYKVDGAKFRYIGSQLSIMNDSNVIDLESGDKHAIAKYGTTDGADQIMRRIGIEHHTLATDFYPQATGDLDAPVEGGGAHVRDLNFIYGYNDTWNGKVDGGQPAGGVSMEQDNDSMRYEDGGALGQENNTWWFWDFDDEANGDSTEMRGVTCTYSYRYRNSDFVPPFRVRYVSFNNVKRCWRAAKNWGPSGTNLMSFDGVSTYALKTQWVRPKNGEIDAVKVYNNTTFTTPAVSITRRLDPVTKNTTSSFEVMENAAANGSYLAVVHGNIYDEIRVDLQTGLVGGTLVLEYSQGGGVFAALTATDGTSGLTNTSETTVTFTPPGDWATDTIDGATGYIVRWRKTAGTVTTACSAQWMQVNERVPLFDGGATGAIAYFGVNTYFTRRFYITTQVAGTGSPTLIWEYWNGSSWVAVSNLVDNTNGFTTLGQQTVSFDQPADFAEVTVNSLAKYWIRCRISAGSFTVQPLVNDVRAVIHGGTIDIKYYSVYNVPTNGLVGEYIGGNWGSDSGFVTDDYGKIYLKEGQTSLTDFYKIGGGQGNPDTNFAEYQALSKAKETTDAMFDSTFNPNGELIAA